MAWLRGHWQLLALTAAVFACWQIPFVIPIKILIVFLHELAHGVTAVLTGGQIVEISVSPEQGGLTITRGGSRFLTLTAGYLGSLGFGIALLIVALRTHWDRIVLGLFGATLLIVTAFYVREGFALLFCIGSGIAMLVAARLLPLRVNDLILRIIGLSSLIYVPYDIFDDTIRRASGQSDARMLAEEIGGPTVMWGAIWLAISLLVIGWCLARGLGRNSNLWGARA